MPEIDINTFENYKVRHHFDSEIKEWLFSVVDVVGILAETRDPRNYWKVLKNRLNKTQKELVTKCNQVKLPSVDGKMYLTDVANTETLIEIAKIVSPEKLASLKEFLYQFEEKNAHTNTYVETEFELPVDGYVEDSNIFIKGILAGVKGEDLIISLTANTVSIAGKRSPERKEKIESIILSELSFGTFSRTIDLPEEINIDESEATLYCGVLTLKLPMINKFRKRILKVKNI